MNFRERLNLLKFWAKHKRAFISYSALQPYNFFISFSNILMLNRLSIID